MGPAAERWRVWLRWRLPGGLLVAAAVAAAVGAFFVNSQLPPSSGPRRGHLLIVGGALTAATILLGATQQVRINRRLRTAEQVAVEAAEDLTVTLGGALAPITNYLGEMAAARDPPGRQLIAGQLLQAVVDAAVRLTVDGARSTYYALDVDAQLLHRVVYAGRSDLPRPAFLAGTPDGDFVLDLVQRGDLVFVDDVDRHPLVTPSTPGGYETVIAVAVTAGSHPLGVLTVDAPLRGDLTATDVELVRVLANLLGSGLEQGP